MKKFNFEKELKFISFEKNKILDKKSTQFELLKVAQAVMVDCVNPENIKMAPFYQMIYLKTKNFYLENKFKMLTKID
ncbi:MAG: hypothetical protein NTY81_00805 [Candidatus Staskawiczbacteria bacterium]|nr:hypothetical protein [Candidatus Staskawiczbacteria bacterium]